MRTMSKCASLLAIALVLLGSARAVHAQLVLYDDFAATKIDPARWWGGERSSHGSEGPNTEVIRKIASGRLNLNLTSFGRKSANTGSSYGDITLHVTDPSGITTHQADVTVKVAKTEACAANPFVGSARAGLVGSYFNDGTSPAPGNRIGDIAATLWKSRLSTGSRNFDGHIVRCTDANCDFTEELSSVTFAATWALGVPDTLRLRWDAAGNQFIFTLNPGTAGEEIHALTYTLSDASPPVDARRNLRAQNRIARCSAGQKRSNVSAFFDSVMVNP